MALHENADWELVAEQVAKETDSQKLTELAAEFNRLLNKRERLLRQHVTKSAEARTQPPQRGEGQ
jgi:hypothetical protein